MAHQRKRKQRTQRMAAQQRGGLPLRVLVYVRSNGRCAYCARELTLAESTMDHQVAVRRGGQTVLENITLACADCNHAKGSKTLEEFQRAG